MVPVIYIAGMGATDRAGLVSVLARRGYRVGMVVSNGEDARRFADSTVRQYFGHGPACLSFLTDHGAVAVFPAAENTAWVNRLCADCHLVVTNCDIPGCIGIIETAPVEGALRYARDPRLRAVLGESTAEGVPIADLIEHQYLTAMLSAAVLAGGKSRRLGRNKALLDVNGKKIIEHVLEIVSPLAHETLIVANDPAPYHEFNVPVTPDIKLGGGPLSGIHGALTASRTDYVLVVSCDLPLLSRECLAPLIAQYPGNDITIYKHKHFEPLCAVYRRTCIPALEELIEHGEYRIIDLFPTLTVKVIRTDDPTPFRNINTWDDYEAVSPPRKNKASPAKGR